MQCVLCYIMHHIVCCVCMCYATALCCTRMRTAYAVCVLCTCYRMRTACVLCMRAETLFKEGLQATTVCLGCARVCLQYE